MKTTQVIGNGILFFICGGLSFLYSLAVALAAGYRADSPRRFSEPTTIPQFLAIWVAPLLVAGITCLLPISRATKIAVAVGLGLPALFVLPSLLQSFSK
ncbi:MAG: hypothetical protein QM758_08410 [Armatimonas sp.]